MKNEFKNTFGKRLEFLMKEKGIDITKKGADTKLAKDMLKTGCLSFYVNVPSNAQGNARVRIGVHRKTSSAENIEGRWLKAYCDYFKCSADYLFGYISSPTHEETDIKKETGLSEKAIKQLHGFTTYRQGKVRLAIIDYFLMDVKFSFALANKINEYYKKIYYYKIGKELHSKELEQLNNLANGDMVKEFELLESGEFIQTINVEELKKRKKDTDLVRYEIIELFGKILEDLVKYFYQKNNKKGTSSKKENE